MVVALVKQVEVRQAELETKAQVKLVELLKQVDERLREVQERPDMYMTERIESIEKSMQVNVLRRKVALEIHRWKIFL